MQREHADQIVFMGAFYSKSLVGKKKKKANAFFWNTPLGLAVSIQFYRKKIRNVNDFPPMR